MATSMTIQDYVDYVLLWLGEGLVEVEIKNLMPKVVAQSLGELREYITLNKFVTIPYMQRIDLTPYKVRSILQVYRTHASDAVSNSSGSTDAFLLASSMVGSVPYDVSGYAKLLLSRQIKNTMSNDLDWRFDDPYLYIQQNPMQSSTITIEYTPNIQEVTDITDDYWIGKLKKLCLANGKILSGRVRGKFQLANSLYVNDATQMLQEGNREKDELIAFLQNNHSGMLLPI